MFESKMPKIENNISNLSNIKEPFIIPQETFDYFSQTMDSRDKLSANKFFKKYIETHQIDIDFTNTPENMEILYHFLNSERATRENPDAIIKIFKEAGLITEPTIEKIKAEIVPEHISIRTEDTTLSGIKHVEEAGLMKEEIEANLAFSELRESNIAGNKNRVEAIYKSLEMNETENFDYYLQFTDTNITPGGLEEVKKDFDALQERKKKNNEKELSLSDKEKERLLLGKKLATVTERGIEYAISNLEWYGEKVHMKPTSEFSDVKRGVDNLLEISKDDNEKDFVGIATDVTYRRLEGEQFEAKFFKLLESIKEGYKTKVKYEKDSSGNVMKEFAVPKVLLHFEYSDMNLFLNILEKRENQTNEQLKEEFKNSPQKINYLEQIVHQCKILSSFAQKYENSIFRRYDAITNSIKELSWTNPEIKEVIQNNDNNKVGKRLDELIKMFEDIMERSKN